jgi:hypothetical protein
VCAVLLRDVFRENITISRYQNASAVRVWGAISKKGSISLVFIDGGVKINGEYYKTEVLEKHSVPTARILYGEEYSFFQQDGSPSHHNSGASKIKIVVVLHLIFLGKLLLRTFFLFLMRMDLKIVFFK